MRHAKFGGSGILALMLAWSTASWGASTAVTEAQLLVNQGKLDQALQQLDRHLKAAPQDAEARFTRGLVLVRMDRNDEAIKAFVGLTRDYPQLPEPYNNLAVIYAQQGEYEKARDSLEAALATHPSYTVAHENLGDIYAALAAAAYNRALTLDQDNPSVRAKLNLINQLDSLGDSRHVAQSAPIAAAPVASPGAAPVPAKAQPEPPRAAVPATTAAPTIDAAAVEKTVRDWAAAWSSRDAARYLSFYSPAFAPEGGMSYKAWEAQRRDRVTRPKSIRVSLSEITVESAGDGRVRATFRQDYQSDTFTNRATKVLELAPAGGGWKIVREFTR